MRYFFRVSVLLLIFFILVIFYFSLNTIKTYDTKDLIGKKISNIEFDILNSEEKFNTKNLIENDFTLINFFASWCGPCRKEHKYLVQLSKAKKLKILGINYRDDKTNANRFLEQLGNPYFKVLSDKKGKKSVNFGVYGIPETILVDKELYIIKKYIGPLNQKDVNKILKLNRQ